MAAEKQGHLHRILNAAQASQAAAAAVSHPERWTAVIAAAGRGTRLGFDKPKILFPVAGRTILDRLIDLLMPFCGGFVFVLSPSGQPEVEPHILRRLGERGRCACQPEPLGMGDAVSHGLNLVTTPYALVVWGDQVALRPATVDICQRLLEGPAAPAAVCPTVWRPEPYIHFDREATAAQRMTAVRQKREGDPMPEQGESDTGLFLFRAEAMRQALASLQAAGTNRGARTGEQNFLPVLPWLDQQQEPGVLAPRIAAIEESLGVNSPEDAAILERHLAAAETLSR